jgi:hypothetical protein
MRRSDHVIKPDCKWCGGTGWTRMTNHWGMTDLCPCPSFEIVEQTEAEKRAEVERFINADHRKRGRHCLMDKTWAQDWINRAIVSALARWREAHLPGLVDVERIALRAMARQMWSDAWCVAAEHDMPVGFLTTLDTAVVIYDLFSGASWRQRAVVKQAA